MLLKIALPLLFVGTVPGQTLRLSSAAAAGGDRIRIEISLESPRDQQPVAMQWETRIPVLRLVPLDRTLQIGPVARSAGKSITCAMKSTSPESASLSCLLQGGQQPIPDGVIAALRLEIPAGSESGSARIRIDGGMAVLKDLRQLSLGATETVVNIRHK